MPETSKNSKMCWETKKDISVWEIRILDAMDTFVLASGCHGEECQQLAIAAQKAACNAMCKFIDKLEGREGA